MKHPSVQNAGPSESRLGPKSRSPTLRGLRVALHRGRLDRQLADGFGSLADGFASIADGFDSDSIEDRALRGRQLVGSRTRRRLARSLRERVKDAERPNVPRLSAAVPVSRRAVRSSRESLLGLAERLESPDPVNPCGVARVLVLLTDGTGPLYAPGAVDRLREAVWWIADGLAHGADGDPGNEPS
jgi:X-X-X-Leu-X-X-Gly heptad repeat protein